MATAFPPVQRYLFDRGFGALGAGDEPDAPPPVPVYGKDDLEHARAEGYAGGRAEAGREQDARREAERRRQASLEMIGAELAAVRDRLDGMVEALGADAVRIALAVARKLLPSRWRETASAEIEALVRETMAGLTDQPAVVVHVTPSLLEELASRMAGGSLRLAADPALAEGDCRIEWRGGGLLREQRSLWRDVEALVEQTVGAAALPAPAADAASTMGNANG